MSAMKTPLAMRNVLRRMVQRHQSYPPASNFEQISRTILSSIDVDDFADAHSASITSTRSTTRSDSIDMTRVLAAPASSGTIIFILPWNIDPKSFQERKTKQFPFRGLRIIGPGQIHDRPARGGFKTSAIEEA